MKKSETVKNTASVFIPKLHKNDDSLFVAVNGKRMLIRKGETVEVPVEFYEVIENSRRQTADAEEFILSRSREA